MGIVEDKISPCRPFYIEIQMYFVTDEIDEAASSRYRHYAHDHAGGSALLSQCLVMLCLLPNTLWQIPVKRIYRERGGHNPRLQSYDDGA
jgi:hypothetical protein